MYLPVQENRIMVVAQIKSLVQKRDRCGVEFW